MPVPTRSPTSSLAVSPSGGKKQALTGAYLSVQGPDAACGAALRARLIGARSHKGELDALIRAEDAGLAAGLCGQPGKSGTDHGTSGTGGGSMKLLIKKEWKLTVTPVPLLFLLLSALVLVPSYPYYVTFFYNALGIFLMLQAARENRDVYYMALLPLTKRDLVRARFSTIVTLQLLQALVCVPFMLLRRGYAEINNPVGIEANLAFLGSGFMLMGLFDLVFLPMHYKNGYDLGKPFVISSIVLFFAIVLLEALDHIVPYMKTVCESYASADLVRQLPVLLGGMAVYALEVWLAYRKSAAWFEKVDL